MHKLLLRTGILITFGMLIIGILGGCGDDGPTEKVVDPPSSAITVIVDTRPPATPDMLIVSNAEFTLTFSQEVRSVMVNGTPAMGSGLNWTWSESALPHGPLNLTIRWVSQNGSPGLAIVRRYSVADIHFVPPVLIHGTVRDGEVNVNPELINQGLIRFDFDEPITGTVKLTDEAGVDLRWTAAVAGQTATLSPIAGQELVNETTYKIEIDVRDLAGTRFQTTITFVTKPK